MANVAGLPTPVPPPPPPGFRLPHPTGGAGGGGLQHPQGQFIPMPVRQRIQNSSRIQDITPPKFMNEAACLEKLTSHAAFTIRKMPARDTKEKQTWARAEVVDEKWAQEDIVKQIKKLNESNRTVAEKKSALAQYQQGQITSLLDDLGSREPEPAFQWSLTQLDRTERLVGRIRAPSKKSLYETVTMTVYVKRAPHRDINPIQLYHNLEKIKEERMRPPPPPQQPKPQPQLQNQQQPQQTGQGGGTGVGQGGGPGGYQQPQGNRPPPPPPAPFMNLNNKGAPPVGQGHAKYHGQGHEPGHGQGHEDNSGNKSKVLKQNDKCGKNRGPKKYHNRSGSSASDSEFFYSDTGSSSDESSLGTSISSRSRQHQQSKHNKDASRSHSRRRERRTKYYFEDRSPSPHHRRMSDSFGGVPPIQQRSYAPEIPCAIPAVDPITSAYQAGKEDAMAERYSVADRLVQQTQQIIQPVIERLIEPFVEPRPVVSYRRLESQYSERPRLVKSRNTEPRYIEDRYVEKLRSVEDDLIVDRQHRAEEYMKGRPRDIDQRPLGPRPEYLEQKSGDFARRLVERPGYLERRHSEVRPEYYERRPIEARQEFFDRRLPMAREFHSRHRSLTGKFSGDSRPFATNFLPRCPSPSTPSTSSFKHGW
ncbi:hypothetical protein PZA11_003051 [Diplocarpon coronariae]